MRSTKEFPVEEDDAEIRDLRIRAMSIRAIGDAAPGDERTTRTDIELRWDDEHAPEPFMFAEAPTGRYSRLEVRIGRTGDDGDALRIDGTVRINGIDEPFEVRSESTSVTASVVRDTMLLPGENATITVSLNPEELLEVLHEDIDFTMVPVVEGKRSITDGSPELSEIVSGLVEAFE